MKQIKNPVVVSESQIKECLIKTGLSEEHAEIKARRVCEELRALVSDKFQDELDYYLSNLMPSDSDIGKKISRLMPLHFNNFFAALSTVAVE